MGTLQQQSILKGHGIIFNDEETLVHRILSSVARKFSKRAAILYEDEAGKEHTVSYEELELLSNQIARVLRKRCQKNVDNFAAVCMKPSHCLPVILTSILKAGMAYLPLDDEFPGARVKHIMQEAEPAIVIVEEDADMFIYDGRQCITFEQLLKEASSEPSEVLELEESNDQLAIILYTSGSTGIPKGVKLPHATLMNRLRWQWRELPYNPTEERCIFKTALTFVDSVSEIWGPLLQGRTIVVVPRQLTKDPEKFVDILQKHQIQRLVMVPSLLQSLLIYMNLQDTNHVLSSLKLWVCSGETLPISLAKQFFVRFANERKILANFYGSTEVMGDVTFHLLSDASQLHELERVPIGKPVDNSIIYIVNKELRVLPHGEVGELLVAGRNLAAGYLRGRDPHRFLDNPHAVDPGYSKIFRTGDYARIIKGIIFYEGRTDAQVKVRGHKVDLAEVEKAVISAPGIDKAVVLCYKPGELSQTLVAFTTAKENVSISELQIEDYIRKSLPPYMVPQVKIVDSIPLLTNGKTDRQTLLKQYEALCQDECNGMIECDYSGIPEEHLSKAQILFPTVVSVVGRAGRGVINVNSNFYELGGNSLNSIYTVTKVRDQGYYISITDFITAKCMAEVLAKMKVNWDSDGLEDVIHSQQYVFELLNNSHKEEVIEMITESFYLKGDLEKWLIKDIKRNDYRILMETMWDALVEKGFSFVIKSADSGKMLGVALNFDARDEPEVNIDSKLTVIFEFLEYIESPIRETRLPKGLGQIFHSFMMTTNQDLSPSENVIIMKELEYYCLELAKRKSFAGIFTTNSSLLTQQLGTDVYNYEVLLDYQVNKYVAPDGSKPFGKAPDDQRAMCSWKPIK